MALKIEKRERPDSQGVWVNIAQDGDGYIWFTDADREEGLVEREPEARLKVAPSSNSRARRLALELADKYQRFRRGGRLPLDISAKLTREVIARAMLEDWEGVQAPGSNGAYTAEAGMAAMEADYEFEDVVARIANELAKDRTEALTGDAETLGNGSAGGSSGAAPKSRPGSKAESSEG